MKHAVKSKFIGGIVGAIKKVYFRKSMWHIPHLDLLWRHRTKILWSVLLFWLLMGTLVYLGEVIAYRFVGAPMMDPIEVKQYLLRWLLWLLFTPFIMLLALKINVGNCKLWWFVLLHILLGSAMLVLEFSMEVAILKPMAERFYHRPVSINEMLVPFLYKYFAYVVNYFLMVGMVNMYVYMQTYYQTRQHLLMTELQNNVLEHELTVQHLAKLKMQIRPHFLFNTLNALNGLILTQQSDKAEYMLNRLSELLRKTLDSKVQEFVTVNDELTNLDIYMDIQRVRFDERIRYTTQISDPAQQAKIPFFLLQPIVENAIQYSVEISDAPIDVQIIIKVAVPQLQIEVRNTFCPLPDTALHGHGIGLSNVRERLERHYGDKASVELHINQDGITVVNVTLPFVHG
jgi:sensor histidine kinase YesM